MKKEKLTKVDVSTLEARSDYFEILKSRLSDWAIIDEEEETKMKSLIRTINKYLYYIEDRLLEDEEENN